MPLYKVTDIQWDLDDTEGDIPILPESIDFIDESDNTEIDDALFDDVADYLSNTYGFCVLTFRIQ